ncbi:hypothetical protein NEMBOFW57_009571 [Staphylotrichum longicolle]|uniref:Uncharacterized protein n=1 Tax=Staphylotrichum longicolle TaxID=669026 RepID=A0AAD4HW27_9PEZI|nr:hypothetical protein NEMBOFW57_009571 [Staphylotrichum longicolle]
MGLITLLRGFNVPIVVLDRFLVAHGVEETYGIAPRLEPGPLAPPLDPQSAFLRARLATAGTASPSSPPSPALDGVRLFIPNRRGQADPTYAYVSHAFIMAESELFVLLTEDRVFPLKRPFVREFETWSALQVHRVEAHGTG